MLMWVQISEVGKRDTDVVMGEQNQLCPQTASIVGPCDGNSLNQMEKIHIVQSNNEFILLQHL